MSSLRITIQEKNSHEITIELHDESMGIKELAEHAAQMMTNIEAGMHETH